MTGLRTPRILDASALVELFSGHSTLMRLIDDATAGSPVVVVPTLAIAEAQAAIDAPSPALGEGAECAGPADSRPVRARRH
ncbi:hypothetical protein [Actinoplanes campanulatus]|uniref:hypothetical protein n=1 Tax=Actinoplanes campanulatus TaxID=113559 RepID=UPI00195331A1|nr:hypothetical protein [Actinoplanes capillaceus]